jgi:hypothetical protein
LLAIQWCLLDHRRGAAASVPAGPRW